MRPLRIAVFAPAVRCQHGAGPRKVNARYVRGPLQVCGDGYLRLASSSAAGPVERVCSS
jgi:hypothetical protein